METKEIIEIIEMYNNEYDITFIMEDIRVDGEPKSMECIGWYHGEPDAESTKKFSNRNMKAIYDM